MTRKQLMKMAISTHLSIITLNVNGLYASIKRKRVMEWTKKLDLYISCIQETHFRPKTHTDQKGSDGKDSP